MEFIEALYKIDFDGFMVLLTNIGPKINSIVNEQGETLLHLAAKEGDKMLNELLIKAGADLEIVDSEGRTPLHLAVISNNVEAIKVFIKANVVVDVVDIYGKTPLHYVSGNPYIDGLLVDAGADIKFILINKSYFKELTDKLDNASLYYIAQRFNKVNDVDYVEDDSTMLMYAAVDGFTNLIKVLLELGADVNILGHDGETAIFGTAANGNTEDNELLVNAGADLTIATYHLAETPLHQAVECENVDAVKVFLKAGADIDALDIDGTTPLDLARNGKNHEIIKLLENFSVGSESKTLEK